MANKFTPAQEQAIQNRGALLVSAAAGSGKTTVLVERILSCILDPVDPVDIHQLLVVTFTNAAAAEMKNRIAARLQEELDQHPDNPRLREQLMYLDKASICTIDAFCKNLITQYFDVLNIPSDFKVISQTALSVLRQKALDETINDCFTQFPRESYALATALGGNGVQSLREAITIIYDYMRSLPNPHGWLDTIAKPYEKITRLGDTPWACALMENALSQVKRGIGVMEQGLKELEGDEGNSPKRYDRLQEGLSFLKKAEIPLSQKEWDQTRSLLSSAQSVGFTGAPMPQSHAKEITVILQQTHNEILELLEKTFSLSQEEAKEQCQTLFPLLNSLTSIVKRFDQLLTRKKRAQNVLDFADIEYLALSLLVTYRKKKGRPTPLAKEIAKTYRYVMVDEFQDSNNLQTAIYNALSDGGKTLFTVGDIKQSIYRFRKANPKNFLKLLETYPPYDGSCSPGTVILDGNFRSRKEICQTVNAFFSLVMSSRAGDIPYDRSHYLIPLNSSFPPGNGGVTMEFLEQTDGTIIETEADRIAMHIKEALQTPCVTEKGELRCATYEDCVILLRSHKNKAPYYVKRLQEHGIPAVADSTDGYFEKREIRMITHFLRCIDHPANDLALLTTLLSPMFGFTHNQVATIRMNAPKTSLWNGVQQAAGQGDQKAQSFVETLSQLRLFAATHTAPQVLEHIFNTYHLLALVQLWERGEARKENLLALLTLARECHQNGFGRLDHFVTHLNKLEEDQESFTPATNVSAGKGVRIMSVHASKGLQFPICFLAGCSGRKNHREATQPVVVEESLGLGITLHNDQTRTHTATLARQAILQENNRCEVSEELRILYVAMTRAVDRLYLFSTLKNPVKEIEKAAALLGGNLKNGALDPTLVIGAQNFGQLFLYFALLHPSGNALRVYANTEYAFLPAETEDLQVALVPCKEILPPPPASQIVNQPTRAVSSQILSQLEQQLSYQNPYAGAEQILAKQSVSALTHHGDAFHTIPRPAFLQKGGLTSAEKGTALHQFMQYADYPAAAENPDYEIRRMVDLAFLTPLQGEAVDTQKLEAFFQSDLYHRMASSDHVMREHRFMASLPVTQIDPTLPKDLQEEQVVVQGIVDCIFEEQGEFVLVDYKTDRVKTPKELQDQYREQLQLYAKILKESAQIQVKELLLYSFCLNQTVGVELPSLSAQ